MSTRTTRPRSPSAVSGSELSQTCASSSAESALCSRSMEDIAGNVEVRILLDQADDLRELGGGRRSDRTDRRGGARQGGVGGAATGGPGMGSRPGPRGGGPGGFWGGGGGGG